MNNQFEGYIGDILFKNKENYNATTEILAKIKWVNGCVEKRIKTKH